MPQSQSPPPHVSKSEPQYVSLGTIDLTGVASSSESENELETHLGSQIGASSQKLDLEEARHSAPSSNPDPAKM